MRKPIYLHGPSQPEAAECGLEPWYTWLANLDLVQVVTDIADVGESGVFISFNAIRAQNDTFPELQGRVDRWLRIDDSQCVASPCKLAEQHDVERIFHARLPDEMMPYCPFGDTLKFIQARGVWVPPLPPPSISSETSASTSSEKLLLIGSGLPSSKAFDTVSREMMKQTPWKIERTSLENLAATAKARNARAVVVDEPRTGDEILALAQELKASKIAIGVTTVPTISPLRFAFLGLRPPRVLAQRGAPLRTICSTMLGLLALTENERGTSAAANWQAEALKKTFLQALQAREPKPFEPAIAGDLLSTKEGLQLLDRTSNETRQLGKWAPSAYLALEFYRQYPPFQLLCSPAISPELIPTLGKLANCLSGSIAAYAGKKNLHASLAAWTLTLLGEYNKLTGLLQTTQPFHFATFADITTQVSLALLYRGEQTLARNCLTIVAERSTIEDPSVSAGYRAMVKLTQANIELPSHSHLPHDPLATHIALALSADGNNSSAEAKSEWEKAGEIDRAVAQAFAKRFDSANKDQ